MPTKNFQEYPTPPPRPCFYRTSNICFTWLQSFVTFVSNMAASAAQTRVKEEVEKSIEKLERDQLRGLQVSKILLNRNSFKRKNVWSEWVTHLYTWDTV